MGDPARKMRLEISYAVAVLRRGAMSYAVRKRGLQTVEVLPPYIRLLVHDHAGEELPMTAMHEASLPMVDVEALFDRDLRDQRRDVGDSPAQRFAARNGQVIGVARVLPVYG